MLTQDYDDTYFDGGILKQDYIQAEEYPCFALSMNAEARNFKDEIVKRCLMICTRTSLPGDQTAVRNRLQRSIARIRDGMTTGLYREYLNRVTTRVDELRELAARPRNRIGEPLGV